MSDSYSPKELALRAAAILDEKKGVDIEVIKVSEITTIADYFVICTGSSSTQVRAFADEVEFKLKQAGILPDHIEGRDTRSWVVLDYRSVVIHIFDPEAREYYDLERLWADGEKLGGL
ncbi:MAG: ribosome silencing factor [Oscillospiraceae bacterium]|nr:ribosome silencing factor [Oscillospiraceae bacterium]